MSKSLMMVLKDRNMLGYL